MTSVKLNKKQQRALYKSIEHWKKIVKREEASYGVINCPLCKKFQNEGCEGCPVREKTGHDSCTDSPYEAFVKLTVNGKVHDKASEKAAKKELKFLKQIWKDRSDMTREEYKAKNA